jgi:hypothetical protein
MAKPPAGFLTGNAAAGGLAMIVSIGNLGGFFGPSLIGYVRPLTVQHSASILITGASLSALHIRAKAAITSAPLILLTFAALWVRSAWDCGCRRSSNSSV